MFQVLLTTSHHFFGTPNRNNPDHFLLLKLFDCRFGKVEVICEGYDCPEDEFTLAGSCGLEYTLDLTREGKQQNQYSGGGGWFSNNHKSSYSC